MILSQLVLNTQNLKDLRAKDDYSIHRIVYDLFENPSNFENLNKTIDRPFLYYDLGLEKGCVRIIILSHHEPRSKNSLSLQTKKISDDFLKFSRYRFEILLNPSYRCPSTSKIISLKDEQEILSWFREKCQKNWGFLAEHLFIKKRIIKTFSKKGDKVTIGGALFNGELLVSNQEQFIESFKNGIGRGKAWGFGLLQLVPIL
jgi:CRISPR system Cascade subunit CasE